MKNKFPYIILLFFTVKFLPAQTSAVNASAATDKNAAAAIFNSDSIVINIHIQGCFANYTSGFVIYKAGKDMQLLFTKGTEKGRYKSISAAELEQIKQLFYKGIDLPKDRVMCTTEKTITASAGAKSVEFTDGRCAGDDDIEKQLDQLLHAQR